MAGTVAELLVESLAELGVRQVFGIVGDALNPPTDAIRRQKAIEWIGVGHEEGAVLAAAGQAKLTGRSASAAAPRAPAETIWSPASTRRPRIRWIPTSSPRCRTSIWRRPGISASPR